jgi:hypothetical protein
MGSASGVNKILETSSTIIFAITLMLVGFLTVNNSSRIFLKRAHDCDNEK